MTDDYAKLFDFRATLFPRFDADQQSAARSIIPLILDDVRAGMIDTLLDVGCGTGEILHYAGEFLAENGLSVRRVGIDASSGELDRARAQWEDCEFVCCTAEKLCTLDAALEKPIAWEKTAVLCVGHTLPHFTEFSAFLKCLSEYRPPLVFVDFYHTWDETIEMLRKQPLEERYEMRMLRENEEMFVLATAVVTDTSRLARGIRTMKLGGRPATFEARFQTDQAFVSSTQLISRFADAGYVPEKELKYDAGYGRMHGSLMCNVGHDSYRHICPTARIINDHYYRAVAHLAKTVLAKEHVLGAMKVFGTRAAVVILPFAPRETFARYVSLLEGIDAPSHLMQVQHAGRGFASLPTAHGLYMALLAQVSSSTVVPLPELDGAARISEIDQAFRKVEAEFFKRSTIGAVPEGHSYFVVPFYFATLPLFCAVLNFTDALPIATTEQEVYIAVLRNFARLVSQELRLVSRDLQLAVEKYLLRPFIDSALTELEVSQQLRREDALNEIMRAFEQSKDKSWKSWLLTIPSRAIKELSTVQQEEGVLVEMLGRAQDHALADVIGRIANWFHKHDFFSGDAVNRDPHLKPCAIHKDRLAAMLSSVNCAEVSKIKECPAFGTPREKAIASVLVWLQTNLTAINRGDEEAFRKVKSVFWRENKNIAFRFSSDRLMSLCEMYLPGKVTAPILKEPNGVVISDDPTPRIARVAQELGRGFSRLVCSVSLTTVELCRTATEETKEYKLLVEMNQQYLPARASGEDGRNLNVALKDATGQDIDRSFSRMELSFVVQAGLQEKMDEKGKTTVDWVGASLRKLENGSLVKVKLE